MSAYQYIIIGGGISGLYAAYLLEQRGITDYLLLEAKSSLGGRLNSAFATDSSGINAAFDLGATWFWEDQQPELAQLIKDLNLSSFEHIHKVRCCLSDLRHSQHYAHVVSMASPAKELMAA